MSDPKAKKTKREEEKGKTSQTESKRLNNIDFSNKTKKMQREHLLWIRECRRLGTLCQQKKDHHAVFAYSSLLLSLSEVRKQVGFMESRRPLCGFLCACSNLTKRLFTFQTEVAEETHSFKANRHTTWKGEDFPFKNVSVHDNMRMN